MTYKSRNYSQKRRKSRKSTRADTRKSRKSRRGRKSRKGRKHVKGGLSLGVLDSKENKFINLTNQANTLLKNLTIQASNGQSVNLKPFLDKLSEIDAPNTGLIPRNKSQFWTTDPQKWTQMTNSIDGLVDTIVAAPAGLWTNNATPNSPTSKDIYERVMKYTNRWPKTPSMRNYSYFGKHKRYV